MRVSGDRSVAKTGNKCRSAANAESRQNSRLFGSDYPVNDTLSLPLFPYDGQLISRYNLNLAIKGKFLAAESYYSTVIFSFPSPLSCQFFVANLSSYFSVLVTYGISTSQIDFLSCEDGPELLFSHDPSLELGSGRALLSLRELPASHQYDERHAGDKTYARTCAHSEYPPSATLKFRCADRPPGILGDVAQESNHDCIPEYAAPAEFRQRTIARPAGACGRSRVARLRAGRRGGRASPHRRSGRWPAPPPGSRSRSVRAESSSPAGR